MSEAEQTGGREEIWLEKYRPQHLSEIVGQDAIVERLESYVRRRDLPHMLFAGPAGVGKCTTGETPVLTSDGLARIEDVAGDVEGFHPNEDGTEVLTFDDSGAFEYAEPSHFFGKKSDDLVSVSTRDGSEMTVTPEHRLLTLTHKGLKWRPAESLDGGERIVRPLRAPLPETDTELDWIGAMDGDRTFVHVTEEFARRLEIPFEENLLGVKKQIVGRLREGASVDTIAEQLDTSRGTVRAAEREFRDADLSEHSTVCSLSYLRQSDAAKGALEEHVRQIQYVTRDNKRSNPITPPREITPEITRFVGLALGEARIENGRIKFYNTDETLLGQFEGLFEDLFGVEPQTGKQQGVPYVAANNRTLTHYLESCFECFDAAMDGEGIGSRILTANEDSRRAFLGALFDAEGHVRETGILELTQKSEERITLIAYLLAGFGIPSRRKRKEKRATNGRGETQTYHTLYISGAVHLARFEDEVGFSVDQKAARLADATERTHNPNDDTVLAQEAVAELCRRLNLNKTDYVPDSLDPDSPGRKRYLDGVSELVDAATGRLERVQEKREVLRRVESTIAGIDTIPTQWIEKRENLEPLGTRKTVARTTGVGTHRLLEYASGDRTPYTGRVQRLLSETDDDFEALPIEEVQAKLAGTIDELNVSYADVAHGTSMRGPDVSNLLDNDDHAVRSTTRFATVRERLDTILSEMASTETLKDLRALHRLVEAEIYLDEVETVDRVDDTRRVYDLTVPGTRNYVAGTVPTVMHNTTAAVAVSRELYGEDWEEHFLELNASDERGIDVVRDRIKSFARTSFGGVDHRIIFLDEADALTSDAQSALRRTMEQFSNNVRFILSCNYSSQIIDPIQSRCAVFRFAPLSDEAVEEQVRKIADEEGIEVTDGGIDALVYAADGDMRKGINGLQAAAVTGGVVDEEAVFEITSTARPEDIREMVTLALAGDFTAARSRLDELMSDEGIAGGDIIDQLHRSVWEFDLDDEAAVRLLDRIGEADYRITEGANERIQLEALLASLALDGGQS